MVHIWFEVNILDVSIENIGLNPWVSMNQGMKPFHWPLAAT